MGSRPQKLDLVIKNAKIVTPKRIFEGSIGIEDGRIASISKVLGKGEKTIDAGGKPVLPGGIDAHTHIHDPEHLHVEDFFSGSKAAAAGGITTIIDYPRHCPLVRAEEIRSKIDVGERNSIIDFSLHAGMTEKVDFNELIRCGVRSFGEIFMCPPYEVDDARILELMKHAKKAKVILNFHAEDGGIVRRLTEKFQKNGRKDPLAPIESRPPIVEEKAVARVIKFTEHIASSSHILHLTTAAGCRLVASGKKREIKISAETCPQHLYFTARDVKKQGALLKVNPPLKSRRDIAVLWGGLKMGVVDFVASDHAPCTRAEKEQACDIWEAKAGVPIIEHMLPILLSEGVNKGRITLMDVCRVMCEAPAKMYGLYPRKGAVRVGSDADLTIVDLKREMKIGAENMHYKVGWSPLDGKILKGFPILTMVRGEVVYDGNVTGRKGHGKFMPMSVSNI